MSFKKAQLYLENEFLGVTGAPALWILGLGLRLGLFRFDLLIFDRSLDLLGVHRGLTKP